MMTDPLADMLTRIRNAARAKHAGTSCPSSRLKLAVAQVLAKEGYLGEVRVAAEEGKPVLRLEVRYAEDGRPVIDQIRRVSRPGRRVYVRADAIPRVRNGLGVAVLSTPKGVLSDRAARAESVGGELLCEVW
jgi:small subunit ribosomal protein S8